MCDGTASDAFRVMKELHQLLLAEKLFDDAKEYWTKVFSKHGEKASWEGERLLVVVTLSPSQTFLSARPSDAHLYLELLLGLTLCLSVPQTPTCTWSC